MKQIVTAKLTVEFPDDVLQPDVEEALTDALKNLSKMLPVMPKVKGKTSAGKEVAFSVKGLERG